jgi:hypothetical protein
MPQWRPPTRSKCSSAKIVEKEEKHKLIPSQQRTEKGEKTTNKNTTFSISRLLAGENKGESEEDWYSEEDREGEKDDEQENDGEQEEDSPWVHATTTNFNDDASDDITFKIRPKKDGIVKIRTVDPSTIHTNPFQPLKEEDPNLNFPNPHSTRLTWWETRADEFNLFIQRKAFQVVTNAQRLAHPCKLEKQQQYRQNQERINTMVNQHLQYIFNPEETTPPRIDHPVCHWWTKPRTKPQN